MLRCPFRLTLFGHSHFEALLKAAVLTAVPRHLVDDAVLVAVTRVDHVLLDASAEEPLWTQTEHKSDIKFRRGVNSEIMKLQPSEQHCDEGWRFPLPLRQTRVRGSLL